MKILYAREVGAIQWKWERRKLSIIPSWSEIKPGSRKWFARNPCSSGSHCSMISSSTCMCETLNHGRPLKILNTSLENHQKLYRVPPIKETSELLIKMASKPSKVNPSKPYSREKSNKKKQTKLPTSHPNLIHPNAPPTHKSGLPGASRPAHR